MMLEVSKVGKSFRNTTALSEVSISLDEGELIALYGPSGSGKTTLLQLIAGMDVPDSGSVQFFGEDISKWEPSERDTYRAKNIGYIFQSFNLIEFMTVNKNIETGIIFSDIEIKENEVEALLEKMGIANKGKSKPYELSHGEKQRVGIARALIKRPALVLADEPTGNLDTKTSKEIVSIMRRQVNEVDRTFLIATHDEMIADYADRVLSLRDGEIAKRS